MKAVYLMLLALLLLSQPIQAQKQTKEQTIEWLRAKMVGTFQIIETDQGERVFYVTALQVSGTVLILNLSSNSADPNLAMPGRITIDLAKLSPDITVNRTEVGWKGLPVVVSTTAAGGITVESRWFEEHAKVVQAPTYTLRFDKEGDLPARVAKAISHLIILSGGKKEAF